MLFAIYILLSLPGVIVAFVVRAWCLRHGWDRTSRAAFCAMIVGLFCSPEIYAAESTIPVVLVTPSLLAALIHFVKGQKWMIFFVSFTITFILTLVVYLLMSNAKSAGDSPSVVEGEQ